VATTSTFALALALLAYTPTMDVAVDRVDLVEVNHYYDEQGRHVFDQTIFYDWCSEQGRYNIRDFRLMRSTGQMPVRDWSGGGYLSMWHDGSVLRKVHATSFRESWTQYDPEVEERKYLKREERRELLKPSFAGVPNESPTTLVPRTAGDATPSNTRR
jgi:hypothetical protein